MRLTWEVSGGDRHLNFYGDWDNLVRGHGLLSKLPTVTLDLLPLKDLGESSSFKELPNGLSCHRQGHRLMAGELSCLAAV